MAVSTKENTIHALFCDKGIRIQRNLTKTVKIMIIIVYHMLYVVVCVLCRRKLLFEIILKVWEFLVMALFDFDFMYEFC